MKRLLTYLAIFFLLPTLHAQSFDWVKGGGSAHLTVSGSLKEAVYSMCTDYNGNVYTLSKIGKTGPIVADTFSLPFGSPGTSENVMFASYTCGGQMRFAKLISGNSIQPQGVVCDTTGHVYVAVYAFHGSTTVTTLRIGYDTSITGLVNQTQMLTQYDTSGHLNWIRFVGDNTTATHAYASNARNTFVAMDGDNNVHYINTTKYGAPLTPTITSHYGNYDLKYDASGNLLSVKRLQLDTSLYLINGICLDKSSGKLYVHGYRDFDTYIDSTYHPYVAAFDTARNLIWKDTLAEYCFSGLGYAAFASITADGMGSLYMTGAGNGCVVFKTDTFVNSMTGQAAFIMRTDTAGNVRWMRGFSASTSINAHFGITVMPNGNVAAAGGMAGTITTGTHTMVTYSGEGQNSSFAILDTAGYVDTLHQIHGTGFYDRANCIVSDRTGSLYIGGQVETDTWAGSLTPYTSVGGNSDFYVMKYGVDCDCTAMPTAAFTDTGTITRGFAYTGTLAGYDSVVWSFGDGSTDTGLHVIHTYTTADTFTVCARVYTSCGTDLYCKTFIIPCVGGPAASFSMSGTGLTRSFTFTGASTGLTGPVSWTFTGGTGATSGSPVSHVFPSAGTYTVCVTATNACGSTTTCNPVTVTCTSTPVSSFTSSGSGLTKFFVYTGTTAGMDSVTWTFGDGGTATGTTPSHTYAIPGTYTVCAKVWTNCGVHTACLSVVVTCASTPTASFTVSGSGATRTFTYTGTTTPAIDSVRWDFGDGGTSTLTSPSHTYATEDTFHVCVTVYTMCGNHTSCQDVIVTCFIPITAAFIDTGVLVHGFAYTGTMAGYDSVVWTFGDGGTDTGLNVIHTYAVADTYHVCATVFTDCGTHTFCRDIILGSVGIPETMLAAISVFPNPSSNELTVANVPQQMEYRIVNVVGVVMSQGALHQGSNSVPITALPSGTYLLEMSSQDGDRKVTRFIKQ